MHVEIFLDVPRQEGASGDTYMHVETYLDLTRYKVADRDPYLPVGTPGAGRDSHMQVGTRFDASIHGRER